MFSPSYLVPKIEIFPFVPLPKREIEPLFVCSTFIDGLFSPFFWEKKKKKTPPRGGLSPPFLFLGYEVNQRLNKSQGSWQWTDLKEEVLSACWRRLEVPLDLGYLITKDPIGSYEPL